MIRDPHALDGKLAAPERHVELLVIGAGPAGIAAAIAGARGGREVLLVDENPVAPDLLRTDVPLYYGGRMTAAVERPDRLLETLLTPQLEAAFEAGVDVALGVTAWGLYAPTPGLATLPGAVVGLADAERSWLVGFDALVVAAGARDLALAFPGWELPGVMGANGFHALVERYRAFNGRRMVILGAGDLGVATALLAQAHGIEVAALIEVDDVASGARLGELRGVPVLTGATLLRAEGIVEVERAVIATAAGEQVIGCDTICMCVGLVPAIELLAAAGAALNVDAARGGHVPVLTGGLTTLAAVAAVGDCAGVTASADALAYRARWAAALAADPAVHVCQCEAVTRGELLGVRPPRYLGATAPARDLATLLGDGPPDQDQVKRLTRAGMGLCQGRRCREQVSLLLAAAAGLPPHAAPFTGYRAPVRPLPLAVLADWAETPEMRAGWDVWLGIAGQWLPYADIGTDREAAHPARLGGNMHL